MLRIQHFGLEEAPVEPEYAHAQMIKDDHSGPEGDHEDPTAAAVETSLSDDHCLHRVNSAARLAHRVGSSHRWSRAGLGDNEGEDR